MANPKPTKTTLKKGDNLPGRGKSERTKILEAMARVGQTEDGFYELLATKAADPKDNFTFNELLKRLSPTSKAVAPTVKFNFPDKAKPHEQASAVMLAVADGLIPPDIGSMFIGSIKSMIDIEEYTDLKDRIEKLEDALNGES